MSRVSESSHGTLTTIKHEKKKKISIASIKEIEKKEIKIVCELGPIKQCNF